MRTYCNKCRYPTSTCICQAVCELDSPVTITIIRHYREASHAKNTARLVELCIKQCRIFESDDIDGLNALKLRLNPDSTALIYPCDASRSLEAEASVLAKTITDIVFLDGSWRQVYSLYHRIDWLKHIPSFHFSTQIQSRYDIRHTTFDNSLSTIEAVSHSLSVLYAIDTRSLINVLQAKIAHWRGPASHRRHHN